MSDGFWESHGVYPVKLCFAKNVDGLSVYTLYFSDSKLEEIDGPVQDEDGYFELFLSLERMHERITSGPYADLKNGPAFSPVDRTYILSDVARVLLSDDLQDLNRQLVDMLILFDDTMNRIENRISKPSERILSDAMSYLVTSPSLADFLTERGLTRNDIAEAIIEVAGVLLTRSRLIR